MSTENSLPPEADPQASVAVTVAEVPGVPPVDSTKAETPPADSAPEQPSAVQTPAPSSSDATPVSTAAEPSSEHPKATSEEPRPRVQLNPDPGGMKAVGSVDLIEGTVTPVTIAPPPAPEPVSEPAAKSEGIAVTYPSQAPVDVPRSDKLDTDLEAEINSALEGVSLGAGVETAPEPGADPPKPLDGSLPKGKRVKGKVVSITGDGIILDLGVRDSGLLSARSFEEGKLPEAGAELDVVVDRYDPAEGLIHVHPARATVTKPAGNWDQIHVDDIVDCMVTKTNKGGLEVTISNIRGFLPASQIDFGFVQNMEEYVGQKLRVKITEVNPAKRNLIVSRRSFLQIERDQNREKIWGTLTVGQVITGTVKTIKDYGAFVDIGGVDGLLHVGELSWNRVTHPKDVLKENQQVEVKILSIDQEKQKIGLGMKQMQANPWAEVEQKYPPKCTIHGKVTKTTDFGAFVQIEPGVEGLIHISELDHKRVMRVTDFLKVDQEVDAQVLTVDIDKKRIALSIKSLTMRPETHREPKKKDEDLAPSGGTAYERKRRGPLKGGGTGSGGLTFGGGGE